MIMKTILIIGTLLLWLGSVAQDTLSGYVNFDKSSSHLIAYKEDTFTVRNYPGGRLEAIITHDSETKKSIYTRYYKNGRKMMIRELYSGQPLGKSVYFDEKGKLVAEFNFNCDTITDTLYLNRSKRLIFGRITYESVVHGGMMREDGTSNISRSSGPSIFRNMYTVRLDSTLQKQSIYKEFRTDQFGDFFLCVNKGEYGFFYDRFDIEKVQHMMGSPQGQMSMSSEQSWSPSLPMKINKNCYNFIHLHSSSVGYAP